MVIRIAPAGGRSLMEIMLEQGLVLPGDCGGAGRCGKCRVVVRDDGGRRSVLACQFVPERLVLVEWEKGAVERGSDKAWQRGKVERKRDRVLVADIGTTTLRIAGVRKNGKGVDFRTVLLNPQIKYGADVLSRISRAEAVRRVRLSRLLNGFVRGLGIDRRHPVTVVGNTVMMHFVFGRSPQGLGGYPYRSRLPLGRVLCARQDGLRLRTLPLLGAFLGSDCFAGILAVGMHRSQKLTLLIDAGTNGEVVLGNCERIVACSTAAGPAFEGATLACGTIARHGAVSDCRLVKGGWRVKTIGNGAPVGICGSGVVSAIAAALSAGLIEPNGRLKSGERLDIADGVYLTQADIREVQLAKAALAAGIKVLLREWSGKKIERVFITGNFGGKLNISAGMALGLLPVVPVQRVRQRPDLALLGAVQAVQNPLELKAASRISRLVKEIRLAEDEDFERFFVGSMEFGRWRN